MDGLPVSNDYNIIVSFRDGSNNPVAHLACESTGALSLYKTGAARVDDVLLGSTNGPVIAAGVWYHLEMQFAAAGAFTLNCDEVEVLSGVSGYNDTNIAQLWLLAGPDVVGSLPTMWLDDLIIRNTAGSLNNGFEGDLRVATIFPAANTALAGWTPNPRSKFGTGIFDSTPNTSFSDAYAASGNANTAAGSPSPSYLGSGDYTLESFVRLQQLPTGTNYAHIFGLWQDVDTARSYQLYLGGPSLEGGNLVFRISTDGTAATINELFSWPWLPQTDTWYHVAICRISGETLLFIDGVQQGLPVADANTYFATTYRFSTFAFGGAGDNGAVGATWFQGWMDELRVTVGYGRYASGFTPPVAAFGRNVGTDPHFAAVTLLCGFNGAVSDESSLAQTITLNNGATYNLPNDSGAAFETINKPAPADDTFIAAPLLPAYSIYTQTTQPSDGQTVTVATKDGSTPAVYRYKTVMAQTYDVQIGASLNTTLANLAAAINAGAGAGTAYYTGTLANFNVSAAQLPVEQVEVTALVAGTAGNALATSTTASAGSWTGTTLAGGTDIPGPSAFTLQRPPNDTTVIASISVYTRQAKTDAGTCQTQVSLIGPLGTVANGALRLPATNMAYYVDTFETDPDTGGALTPTTVVGASVQVNRTE